MLNLIDYGVVGRRTTIVWHPASLQQRQTTSNCALDSICSVLAIVLPCPLLDLHVPYRMHSIPDAWLGNYGLHKLLQYIATQFYEGWLLHPWCKHIFSVFLSLWFWVHIAQPETLLTLVYHRFPEMANSHDMCNNGNQSSKTNKFDNKNIRNLTYIKQILIYDNPSIANGNNTALPSLDHKIRALIDRFCKKKFKKLVKMFNHKCNKPD